MTFSKKLKYYRKKMKLTQEELASQLGITYQTINRLEGDLNNPSKNTVELFNQLCKENNVFFNINEIGFRLIDTQKLKIIFKESKRKTEQEIPELIERLIKESNQVFIETIRFQKGDAINSPGIDGYLVAESNNEFVPDGISYWEIGTLSKKSRSKIISDLDKRTKEYNKNDKKSASIICIASSPLSEKQIEDIEKEYVKKGWKEVRIYDLIKLETWLSVCPSTSAWLLEKYFNRPIKIESFSKAVDDLFNLTKPKSTANFYIADRDKEKKLLLELIEKKQTAIRLLGPSRKETYGFVLSSVYKEEKSNILNRIVICSNYETLEQIDNLISDAIIILNFELSEEYKFGNNIHILILDRKDYPNQNININLYERSKYTLYEILEKEMEVPSSKISKIKTKAENNLLLIIKYLLNDNVNINTQWVIDDNIDELIPILLIGKYDKKNKVDAEILKSYINGDLDLYNKKLLRWQRIDGSPLTFHKDIVKVNSKSELWSLLYENISIKTIDKIKKNLIDIFVESNKKYNLKPNERYMSQVLGKNWKYDNYQIINMFDCITLFSIYSNNQSYADNFIEELLNSIKTKVSMLSISEYFDSIIECSPKIFINYIEKEIQKKESLILSIFEDETNSDILFSTSNYQYLIHALEKALLFKEVCIKALNILYEISKQQFEYKYSNTPKQTFIDKMHWANNSTALSLDDKKEYIINMSKKFEDLTTLIEIVNLDSFVIINQMNSWRPIEKVNSSNTSNDVLEYFDTIINAVITTNNKYINEKTIDGLINAIKYNRISLNSVFNILEFINKNYDRKNDIFLYKKLLILKNYLSEYPDCELLGKIENTIKIIEPKNKIDRDIVFLTSSNYDFELFNIKEKDISKKEIEITKKQVLIFNKLKNQIGLKKLTRLIFENKEKNSYDFNYLYEVEFKSKELEVLYKELLDNEQLIIISRLMMKYQSFSKTYIKKINEETFNKILPYISDTIIDIVEEKMLKNEEQKRLYYSNMLLRDFNNKDVVTNIIKYNPMEYLNAVAYRLEFERWNINEILKILLEINENDIKKNHDIYCIQHILKKLDDNLESKELLYAEIRYFDIYGFEEIPKCFTNYIFKNPEEYLQIYRMFVSKKNDSYKFWYKINQSLKLPTDFYHNMNSTDNFIDKIMNYEGKEDERRYIRYNLGKILARTRIENNNEFLPIQVCDLIEKCNDEDVNQGVAIGYYNSLGVRTMDDGTNNYKEYEFFKNEAEKKAIRYPNTNSVYTKIANEMLESSKRDKRSWLELREIL